MCDVCCESTTPKKNKKIQCSHCQFSACTSCCKKYILSILNDAKCMNCGKLWNIDFLVDNFSYAFINGEYKKHREDIIFDRQLSMMEDTQKIIEKRKEIHEVDKEITACIEIIDKTKNTIGLLKNKKWNLQYGKDSKGSDTIKFYGHCPFDGCRGFITNSGKCGICENKVCLSCKEPILDDEAHACKQETLDTLAKIRKDSKPCPKCKCMIHRIEGCRQMWCVMCHSAFDWQTGELVTSGVFHNPHYVEWQRRNGTLTVNNNRQCDNFEFEYISVYNIERTLRCDVNKKNFIIEFLRCLYHIYDNELLDYRRNRRLNEHEKYLRLRIEYIENNITKEEFKNKLQQQEKKENKKLEISMVYEMFYNTGRTILNDVIKKDGKLRTIINEDELNKSIKQINDLIEYTNSSMNNISKKYKNKVPNISFNSNNKFSITSI